MRQPSTGRIVLYKWTGTPEPYAAIIIGVPECKPYTGDTRDPEPAIGSAVELQVFWRGHQGSVSICSSSSDSNPSFHLVPFSPVLKDGHWSWPPKVDE